MLHNLVKLISVISLSAILGACASDFKKEEPAMARGSSKGPGSPLAGTQNDLRRSAKFTTLSQNIRFNVASSELNASSRRALDEIAAELKATSGSYDRIRIAGMTDPQGDPDRNQRLSEARAESVRNYLISKGVPASKLETIGRGAVARDGLGTASQMARDRRVDFEIVE